jgi:hypothetical protein
VPLLTNLDGKIHSHLDSKDASHLANFEAAQRVPTRRPVDPVVNRGDIVVRGQRFLLIVFRLAGENLRAPKIRINKRLSHCFPITTHALFPPIG